MLPFFSPRLIRIALLLYGLFGLLSRCPLFWRLLTLLRTSGCTGEKTELGLRGPPRWLAN